MDKHLLIGLSLLLLLGVSVPARAQVPQTISVQLYLEEQGAPVTGTRDLEVSWFPSAVGGSAVHTEQLTTDVIDGIATIFLGSVQPLPPDLLLSGPFWLGIRVDGGPELSPRTALASVPYAMLADRARIAQALAPEVTGVVTSLNEIAGSVHLEGGSGIAIQRDGSTLRVTSQRTSENGIIEDRPGEYRFHVTPLTTLLPQHGIHATVTADTHIAARVTSVDLVTNTFTIELSAPLANSESVHWRID